MRCEEIEEVLPAYVKGGDASASLVVRRHLSGCARCRQELSRYESLMSHVRAMESSVLQAPEGLLDALVSIPSSSTGIDVVRRHVSANRPAYLGVSAAAALAGAALWASRRGRPAAARA